MPTSTEGTMKKLIPVLSKKEKQEIFAYYTVYEKYEEEFSKKATEDLINHPVFGELIRDIPKEVSAARNKLSRELQKDAIINDNWQPYIEYQIEQGIAYAKMGLDFKSWFEVIALVRNYLTPYLQQEYGSSAELLSSLNGMNLFLDIAMGIIGEAYIQEKEGLIKEDREKIKKLNEELEQKVIERTAELIIANKKLIASHKSVSNLMEDATEAKNALEIINKDLNNEITERKKAEVALRESEEKYKTITQSTVDVIFTLNKSGKLLFINESVERVLGYKVEEVIGKSFTKFVQKKDLIKLFMQIKNVFQHKEVSNFGTQIFHKDGHLVDVEINGRLITQEGKYIAQGSIRDITERKQAEKEIAMLALSLRSVNESVVITDMEDKILFVNEALLKTYCYNENELNGKHISILRSLNNPPELVGEIIPATLRGGWKGELWNKRKDGSEFPIYLSTTVINDKEGKLLGLIGVAHDITERKRAEEALRESEAKFSWLFENVPDGIYLSTPDGKLVNVNETLVQMLGYNSKEELLAADIVNELYMNPLERTLWIQKLEVSGKLRSNELHLKRKDGSPLTVRENAHLLADKHGMLYYEGTLTDITKLKEAEKAQRSSEIRFRSVWENSAEGMRLTDQIGIIIAVNEAFCNLIEMKAQDLIEQPITVTYRGEKNKENILRNYQTRFNERNFPAHLEQKIILPSCKTVYLDGTYTFVDVETSNALLLSVFRDVTERKLSEQALKKNKLMMNHAEEIAHLGSWEWDLETDRLNCSPELYQIYGLQQENFDGKFESILKLVHPEDSNKILANINHASKSHESFEHYERIIRPDGETRILYTKGIVLDDSEGYAKTIYGSCLDITEFKRVENALINSREKLRALSASLETAREEERSYIARELHDELGQVLTAIKMDLTLMQDDLQVNPKLSKEEITEQLIQIEKMADRLIITVRNIATELRPDILDHLGLIAALEWHAKEFEKRHKVRCVFNSNLQKIDLGKDKATAVFRIFQETLTNVARHSGASQVTAKVQLLGDKLLLEVEDNGKGISEEQLFNITSIGIIGMKERAKFIGGRVFIEGREGGGTKVFFEVPLSPTEKY